MAGGTFAAGPRIVPVKQLHRQAMGALAAVSAVVLVAAVGLMHSGSKIGLLQAEPVRIGFVNAHQLVSAPVWKAREAKLEHAKNVVGQALAQDMRKMWKDRTVDKKQDTFTNEEKQLSELKQVETLKARYDAIESALARAPKLQMMRGVSAGRPGEMLVEDPRTGQVYMLYEYHVPGAGTSAEYLGGDGGMESDYDAVSAPSEYFATDEKGDAPFTNAITRTDKDQGTYHDYAGDGWTEMKPYSGAPQLYEYHVPGDYLGGDGGVESDYDAVTAPSDFYGLDQKGDAAFADAAGRSSIYQGDYHAYEGGGWTNMKSAPQQLAMVPMQMLRPEVPEYMVMRDNAGELRMVDPRAIEGLEARRMAQQNAQLRMANQILAQRRERQSLYYKAEEQQARDAYLAGHARQAKIQAQVHDAKVAQPADKKAFVPHKVVPQKVVKGHFVSNNAANAAKKGKKADGKTEMLANTEAFESSTDRTWGKVYEPKLATLSPLIGPQATHPLSGLAAKEFKRWDKLAQKVTDVYDPMKSDDENQQLMMGHNGNWYA
jgi:hypothetical protein